MTTPTIAAIADALDQCTPLGPNVIEWLAPRLIAAMFDNLDREAMVFAVQGYWPQGAISLYFAEQLVNLAIAAGRQAALGASATPTEG